MTLCDFLNLAVPLGKRVRHDLGVTFAGACIVQGLLFPKVMSNMLRKTWTNKRTRQQTFDPEATLRAKLFGTLDSRNCAACATQKTCNFCLQQQRGYTETLVAPHLHSLHPH